MLTQIRHFDGHFLGTLGPDWITCVQFFKVFPLPLIQEATADPKLLGDLFRALPLYYQHPRCLFLEFCRELSSFHSSILSLRESRVHFSQYRSNRHFLIVFKHPILLALGIAFFSQIAERTLAESSVNLSLSFPLKALETEANKNFPKTLFNKSGMKHGSFDLQLKIFRDGNVNFSRQGEKLKISAPIRFDARVDWSTKFLGATIRHHETTNGNLDVIALAFPSLSHDWHVQLKPESSFRWRKKPKFKLGPIEIDLSRIAEPAIQTQLDKLAPKIEANLNKKLNLKSTAETLWTRLQAPVRITPDQNYWLQPNAKQITASNPTLTNSRISIQLGVICDPIVTLGHKPQSTTLPFPPLSLQGKPAPKPSSKLQIQSIVSHQTLESLLSQPDRAPFKTVLGDLQVKSVNIQVDRDNVALNYQLEGDGISLKTRLEPEQKYSFSDKQGELVNLTLLEETNSLFAKNPLFSEQMAGKLAVDLNAALRKEIDRFSETFKQPTQFSTGPFSWIFSSQATRIQTIEFLSQSVSVKAVLQGTIQTTYQP